MAVLKKLLSQRLWPEAKWDTTTPELDQYFAARDQGLGAQPSGDGIVSLQAIVREAWQAGQEFPLSDIGYGPTHWKGERFGKTPFPYYHFLAGLVHSQNCQTIFEVGAHYGGSSRSMLRGMRSAADANLLTVDISDLNADLHHTPGIRKLTGDANSNTIIKQALRHFEGGAIDLLYIDAAHHFSPTLINIGLYCFLLRPRFVVLDDIALNPEMQTLWHSLRWTYPDAALNCVDVVPEVRNADVGFGLIRLR